MSSKNFRKSEGPTGVSAPRFPAFVKNINSFYELCGSNDSEAARRLGVKPQQFNEWRKGDHAPSSGMRKHIAAMLKMDEHELMHGHLEVKDGDPIWHRGKRDRETEQILDELLSSDDDEIMRHLKRQVLLLKDLLDFRRGKK